MIQSPRRCRVYKEAVWPCWPWHRGKPVIAHGKFLRKSCDHGKLIRGITFHDLTWIGLINLAIVRNEATIIDLWIIAFDSAELYLDISKLVAGIVRHHPVRGR